MSMISEDRKLATEGRLWRRGALNGSEMAQLSPLFSGSPKVGARVSLSKDLIAALDPKRVLGPELYGIYPKARPTRVVTFAKTDGANWGVPWHQDRVIAVAERHELDGYATWTKKTGQWHCEPPIHLLKSMLFVRIHLDDATQNNGAMEIAVGSHVHGLVAAPLVESCAQRHKLEVCTAAAGDILILNMLTLHRSRPSMQTKTARRTIRVDYATQDIPPPLSWPALT